MTKKPDDTNVSSAASIDAEDPEEEIIEEPLKIQALRNQEYYDCQEKIDWIYDKARNGGNFRSLMNLICDEDNICLAYRNLKSNKGSRTPGVDGRNIFDLKVEPEKELVERIQRTLQGTYIPDPVKRVFIPKPGSDKKRPLGIPTIDDRLIQQCIKQIIEPIYEAHAFKHNYGFRPDRSTTNAIARFYHIAQSSKLHYVVDIDIKGFFDNVNHAKLKQQLWTNGIHDKKLLSIIGAILKAPIQMPDGEMIIPEAGTPQGGIISPILANFNLNELDQWVYSQYEGFPIKRLDGKEYANDNSRNKALKKTGLKPMKIVRYADDFKIFTDTRENAEKILHAVTMWLEERLGLEVAPDKTCITNLRKQYSYFLGLKIKLRKKGDHFVIISRMSEKAHNHCIELIKNCISEIQRPRRFNNRFEAIQYFNSVIMDIHEYYDMATHISLDMNEIAFLANKGLYNRILKYIDNPKKGKLNPKSAIAQKYGNSKQLRYVDGYPLVPIAYVRFRIPPCMNQDICRYTEEGRELIHDRLRVDLTEIRKVMRTKTHNNRSMEYWDNRIPKYSAQYGRCAVTGVKLKAHEICCHHKRSNNKGPPDDSYDNLVIVHKDVHRLIHARKEDTIMKYLSWIEDEDQLNDLNKLRRLAGNSEITNWVPNGLQLSFF